MSINPTLKNEQLVAYLATDDSIEALEKAVENGQTRLALQVVLDLVSELTQRVMDLEDIVYSVDNSIYNEADAPENTQDKEPIVLDQPMQSYVKEEVKKDDMPVIEEAKDAEMKAEETKNPQ